MSISGVTGQSLAAIPFFAGVSPAVAERYGPRVHWLTAAPDQLLVDFDDASDDVFFVVSGTVRVAMRTPGGRELILDDIPAGRFFGEMAAIDGAPRSAAVTALHRSRICRVPGQVFMALLADAPELSRRLMRVLVQRLREANGRMLELTTLDIRHRLYADLLRAAGPPMAKLRVWLLGSHSRCIGCGSCHSIPLDQVASTPMQLAHLCS